MRSFIEVLFIFWLNRLILHFLPNGLVLVSIFFIVGVHLHDGVKSTFVSEQNAKLRKGDINIETSCMFEMSKRTNTAMRPLKIREKRKSSKSVYPLYDYIEKKRYKIVTKAT